MTLAKAADVAVLLGSEIFNRCTGAGTSCDYAFNDRLLVMARITVPIVVVFSALGVTVRIVREGSASWVPIARCASLVSLAYVSHALMDLAAR